MTEPLLGADGYRVGTPLPARVVASLDELYASLDVPVDHAFYASSNDEDPATVRRVHDRIVELLVPALGDLLEGREPFLGGFVSKGRKSDTRVAFHQDLTYTDERHHRTVVIWVPLVDVDTTTGALRVVPGSHRWTTGVRPATGSLPTEAHQVAFDDLAVTVPLAAGTPLAYDAALVHGSNGTHLDRPRVAVGVAAAPAAARLQHSVVLEDGGVESYQVDHDFYVEQSLWSRPAGYPEAMSTSPPVHVRQFDHHLRRARTSVSQGLVTR